MSFDLALDKGTLTIGADGDIGKVRNTSKLVQDVLKGVYTPSGSNPYLVNYGNPLTFQNIGEVLNTDFMEARVSNDILQIVQMLQSVQRNQELVQEVTPSEKIKGIVNISALKDSIDPRQFDIDITILTGALETIKLPTFTFSTTI